MISSIGSTCNIAIFSSVHSNVKWLLNVFERNCRANLLKYVSTGNESLFDKQRGYELKSRCNNVALPILLTYSRAQAHG